jgi:hypothetical protein
MAQVVECLHRNFRALSSSCSSAQKQQQQKQKKRKTILSRFHKGNCIKLKAFCTAKATITGVKIQVHPPED